MRSFLVLSALLACGCGGADLTIPDGGTPENDGGNPMGDSGGNPDGGNPDACVPAAEICGDMLDNDCNGQVDDGCKGLGTYVSGATGLDTNPGTQKAPVKTIKQGIANAQMIGGKLTVYVAGSHYPEKVTLVEGISLDGGYHCDMMTCDWMRNPGTYDTAILNQDFEGVLTPASITRQTRIDGFRIQGMSGAPGGLGSSGISVLGSPTITQNRINGGDITGGRTTAIQMIAPIADPAGALIENNDIQGGASGTFLTVGIGFDFQMNPPMGAAAAATIRNNRIKGGTGEFTTCVTGWSAGAQTAVIGNTITNGNSPGGNNGTSSWGISVFGTMLIDSNLINTDQNTVGGCNGIQWCGGIQSFSSTSTITNNVIFGNKAPNSTAVYLSEAEKPAGVVILNGNVLDGAGIGIQGNLTRSVALTLHIFTGVNSKLGRTRNNIMRGGINFFRYGVYEDQVANKTNKPEVLEFNNFYFPPLMPVRTDSYWHQWNGVTGTDTMMAPAMNQSGDPLLDATFHLMGGSPCIDKGTMTEAPAKDRDGQARPIGPAFDIGADEK